MKTYRGLDVLIHVFLTSALAGGEWSASRPGRLTQEEGAPGAHRIGGWVGSRACLDAVEGSKILPLAGLKFPSLGHSARSQSEHRLSYPGISIIIIIIIIC
jgi:hypothetical protein